jgi:RNA polymerase sigma-70 factor (ECF subfamily)
MSPISNRPVDWERLVTDNENRLYRAALAILGDAAEAEDAVQETFLKYLEKRPTLDGPEHQRNWLMRVLVNGCKNRLRAAWRRNLPLNEAMSVASPEEQAVLEELYALPPKDRAVIHLYYYEGYKTAEIAQITGEREGTVRSRMSRARARLRTLLTEEDL